MFLPKQYVNLSTFPISNHFNEMRIQVYKVVVSMTSQCTDI
jgi:hypothetical protein